MPQYGYKLMSELHGPAALVHQAVRAEEVGFDFAGISDHYHPWLDSQHHSPFAWTVLGAIAQATEQLRLVTMVTCPYGRYHPAVTAQMAATMAVLSDGRFVLGVGSGELLNEHVTATPWPSADHRHEHLREALEAMRALWSGGVHSYHGRHVTVDDARLYDLPDEQVPVAVAASGPASAALAADLGDGLVSTDPDAAVVGAYVGAGGDRSATWAEVPLSWDPDTDAARRIAHERFRFGALGWKVMPELPNPVNFEAATAHLTVEQASADIACGPDPKVHADAVRAYLDAGFEHVAVLPVGDDLEGFLRFWTDAVRPLLP
ncbi:MAG: TIGR03557 family F420-dependent LLM class oxidoreductase [Acidimicrobiia bacterium]|nr:TIGR03557 family F420-dependent LLM class oxidoreductase [Acidimicrobiia bacterium]